MLILGVHAGHDSAAAVVVDGQIVAAAAEERFSRLKSDASFPEEAIQFCLDAVGARPEDVEGLAIAGTAGARHVLGGLTLSDAALQSLGVSGFTDELPLWRRRFPLTGLRAVSSPHHHKCHAASAYLTSGLGAEPALVISMDGAGDNYSAVIWRGEAGRLAPLRTFDLDASLGWFYAAATEALGWSPGGDEWKLMGLAPYGAPRPGRLAGFHPEFANGECVKTVEHRWRTTLHRSRWASHVAHAEALRNVAREIGDRDFAAEVQRVAEEQALNLILPWIERTGLRDACCAGGFFLNVKFNQRLWETGLLTSQWIFPDAGDAGLAVGAALILDQAARGTSSERKLPSAYLGPSWTSRQVETILDQRRISYRRSADVVEETAAMLARNMTVGLFQGAMELGPRALGHRSILMSPLKAEHKDVVNAKIKFREAFRPFCPSLPLEAAARYFDGAREEGHMTTSFTVRPEMRERIPAVVHVDGTARPQMVRQEAEPRFHAILERFGALTGEPVLLNTSFNLAGEPMICSPRDALRTFFDSGLDALAMEDCIIEKCESA